MSEFGPLAPEGDLDMTASVVAAQLGTDPSAVPCVTAGVDNGVCAYGQPASGTFGTSRPGSERAPKAPAAYPINWRRR